MKIAVVPTINPTSVSEQSAFLAERLGAEVVKNIDANAPL